MLLGKNRIILIVCGMLGATAPVHADAVTDWNQFTLEAVTVGRPGPIGMVDVALVQVAVHDAVQALERRFEPYHAEVPGARGRRSAAVAAAAHDVLVGMYPAQAATLDATYLNYLTQQQSQRRPGDSCRAEGCGAHSAAAACESGPAAAAFCGRHQPRRLAPDQFIPGKSAHACSVLSHGRAVDGGVRSFHSHERDAFSCPTAACTDQRAIRSGLQRSEGTRRAGEQYTHRRTDRHRLFLQRELPGAMEPRPARNREPTPAQDRRQRPALRARQSRNGRCRDHGLGLQEGAQFLAAAHGDTAG